MQKVVVGYVVHFKGHPDTRDEPVFLSIEGGQSAIKQWQDGEATIVLKGNAIALSNVSKIERNYAWSERDAHIKLASGEGITEDQATKQLAATLGRTDVLQPVSQFGKALSDNLPKLNG